jgi:alpha-1,3-rhamnosyl/mannosyltransferase
LKVVLAVDAVFPPLTGIGRYAWELARRLPQFPEIESLRWFSMGTWVPDRPGLDRRASGSGPGSSGWRARFRIWASRQTWAVDAFSLLGPPWMQYRLRNFRGHLFHSPNYFLPPGTGPGIATVHDLSIYRHPETHPPARVRYFRHQFEKSLRRARHLITDSEAVRQELLEFSQLPEHRVTAIPLGVDPSFRPRPASELASVLSAYGLKPDGYVLCVSTLEPRKNIRRLLEAHARLPDELRRGFPLILAGGRGWLEGNLLADLAKAEAQGQARHLGFVPQEALPALYAGARGSCLPSLYEGFGLPILESMAAGTPVLTSNRSSLPEAAGGAALLVDPEQVEAIRDSLVQLLTDDPWREQARGAGLAVAARHTWENCVQRTVEVYRAVWETASRGAS